MERVPGKRTFKNRLPRGAARAAKRARRGTQRRTVAVLFSGGDAPGMNAFLRFFARLGLHEHDARVLGVKDGYAGLVRAAQGVASGATDLPTLRSQVQSWAGTAGLFDPGLNLLNLDHVAVSGLCGRGGIVLGAARCPAFLLPEVRQRVADMLRDLGVQSLVTVGGNGTLAGARQLAAESDLQVVGVPATIDNDVACTEMALGFDTAVNNTMRAIEALNDTAGSHHRIMVVQTMGRDCGNLARLAALAAGAEIIVIPERGALTSEKAQGIARRLEQSFGRGQTHAIVVVAEGVLSEEHQGHAPAAALRAMLERHFQQGQRGMGGVEVRDAVLGHVQRGGCPTAADRLLAAKLAAAAWRAIIGPPRPSGVAAVRLGQVEICSFEDRPTAESSAVAELEYQTHKVVSTWE